MFFIDALYYYHIDVLDIYSFKKYLSISSFKHLSIILWTNQQLQEKPPFLSNSKPAKHTRGVLAANQAINPYAMVRTKARLSYQRYSKPKKTKPHTCVPANRPAIPACAMARIRTSNE